MSNIHGLAGMGNGENRVSFPKEMTPKFSFKGLTRGHLGGSVVEHLPLAEVVILGSWDQVLYQAPCREPVSPSAYVSACLCLS